MSVFRGQLATATEKVIARQRVDLRHCSLKRWVPSGPALALGVYLPCLPDEPVQRYAAFRQLRDSTELSARQVRRVHQHSKVLDDV